MDAMDAMFLHCYRQWRTRGHAPDYAAKLARAHGSPRDIYKPSAAQVALGRCQTRAKLLTGMRDTWRLAYAVARQERRAGLI